MMMALPIQNEKLAQKAPIRPFMARLAQDDNPSMPLATGSHPSRSARVEASSALRPEAIHFLFMLDSTFQDNRLCAQHRQPLQQEPQLFSLWRVPETRNPKEVPKTELRIRELSVSNCLPFPACAYLAYFAV